MIDVGLNLLAAISSFSLSLSVPALISENLPDIKMITDIPLPHYIDFNSTSAKPRNF